MPDQATDAASPQPAGTRDTAQEAKQAARDAAGLLGDTVRLKAGDFVNAIAEALRAGGNRLAERRYRMAADCFDSAAQRVESVWADVERPGAVGLTGESPLRQRLRSNPTVAYGAALAAGFLLGVFLRAGVDDPDELP